ncbi:MAG: DoxX family protein [Carboxylicivirga sp.]|jgi:hypothetical protein|nr:DoxX family protein [Carboxylicivirga sp.]
MNKRDKIIYWIATGLLSAMMLMSAGMYIFNNDTVTTVFTKLGFPTFIIYPLAVAKILGVIAILSNFSRKLTEWAYAGFFFDFVLAAAAHIAIKDGEEMGASVALALLFVSYIFGRKR